MAGMRSGNGFHGLLKSVGPIGLETARHLDEQISKPQVSWFEFVTLMPEQRFLQRRQRQRCRKKFDRQGMLQNVRQPPLNGRYHGSAWNYEWQRGEAAIGHATRKRQPVASNR